MVNEFQQILNLLPRPSQPLMSWRPEKHQASTWGQCSAQIPLNPDHNGKAFTQYFPDYDLLAPSLSQHSSWRTGISNHFPAQPEKLASREQMSGRYSLAWPGLSHSLLGVCIYCSSLHKCLYKSSTQRHGSSYLLF